MRSPNKFIVITSIFPPSSAVRAFAALPGHQLVVVGDQKTPRDWACENAVFIPLEEQEASGHRLGACLPRHHYCRKMMGYLYALQHHADVVIDSDDDNVPRKGWGFPSFDGAQHCLAPEMGFVNIYELFTSRRIWPRGFPLRYVTRTGLKPEHSTTRFVRVGVWQGLVDQDPDVDAVYRLTCNEPCIFDPRPPCVLGRGTITPFNSQNTAVRQELFPLLYLPTTVSFRFTDILRAWVAQPIMWLHGYQLGFVGANVVQRRNAHDYFKDFESELPMYQTSERAVDAVGAAVRASDSLSDNLHQAYAALARCGIVQAAELERLEAWLQDGRPYFQEARQLCERRKA